MFNADQLKNLDVVIRTIKNQNRILNGALNEQLQDQQDAVVAATTACQEALDNGNFDSIALHTAAGKAARKRITDIQTRIDAAQDVMDAAMSNLASSSWVVLPDADATADVPQIDPQTEDDSDES